MASMVLTDVGPFDRSFIRSAALRNGLNLVEAQRMLFSDFRLTGPSFAVLAMQDAMDERAREILRAEHAVFVERMEAGERRRASIRRLFMRKVRMEPLTLKESRAVLDRIVDVHRQGVANEDATRRMRNSIERVRAILSTNASADTISTIASVAMRYLKEDVRLGNVKLRRKERKDVLAMEVTMDTWR